MNPRVRTFRRLGAQPLCILKHLGRHGVAKIIELRHLSQFECDAAVKGSALEPLDCLILGLDLNQPIWTGYPTFLPSSTALY